MNQHVAGVDEVGRGSLAGPVLAAAVVLPEYVTITGLTDSKKLSAKRREELAKRIKNECVCYSIGSADSKEIDELNILQATMLAMTRAVESLKVKPDLVLVDGNRIPTLTVPAKAMVGGDGTVAEISAASIVAKVQRDAIMRVYSHYYPHYGFDANAGYGTKKHLEAIAIHGVTPIHRRSFAPVRNSINKIL